VPDPVHGTAVVEGPRYLLSETPGRVVRSAPDFSQDNAYVLTEILGMSVQEMSDLDALGVLR
jgi:benzylsuccinate CoA-transferase BbsF subunit